MSQLTKKQAIIDQVREQYTQGLITRLEYLNGAIQAVNDYNEEHLTGKQSAFGAEGLTGLALAIAVASSSNRVQAEDARLNFYI